METVSVETVSVTETVLEGDGVFAETVFAEMASPT